MRVRLPVLADSQRSSEENYLASVSDLMVGLLFVFLIMLMSFVVKYRKESHNSEQKMARLEQAHTQRSELLRRVQETLKKQGTDVDIDLKNGVIRLKAAALFNSGDARLQESAKAHIGRIAYQLHANLAHSELVNSVESVLVEGHTDNQQMYGSVADGIRDNWDLSYQRAKQTYQALLAYEPHLADLQNPQSEPLLSMSAYGEERPIAPNGTDDGRARNRRIDIRIIIAAPVSESEQKQEE